MRKRIIGAENATEPHETISWLNLELVTQVELTSEERGYPIEAALRGGPEPGWHAGEPGPQSVRLSFAQPQQLRRIRLVFQENEHARTQEFALRWSADGGRTYQELLRQQYTFSPPGTCQEVEDYQVELSGVTDLALQITPDISGGPAHASMTALQVG